MAAVRQWRIAQMARRCSEDKLGLVFKNPGRKRRSTSMTLAATSLL